MSRSITLLNFNMFLALKVGCLQCMNSHCGGSSHLNDWQPGYSWRKYFAFPLFFRHQDHLSMSLPAPISNTHIAYFLLFWCLWPVLLILQSCLCFQVRSTEIYYWANIQGLLFAQIPKTWLHTEVWIKDIEQHQGLSHRTKRQFVKIALGLNSLFHTWKAQGAHLWRRVWPSGCHLQFYSNTTTCTHLHPTFAPKMFF